MMTIRLSACLCVGSGGPGVPSLNLSKFDTQLEVGLLARPCCGKFASTVDLYHRLQHSGNQEQNLKSLAERGYCVS